MKDIIFLIGFLTLFVLQQPAFSQHQMDGRQLLKDIKDVNSQIMETRIELGEALLDQLDRQGNDVQSEKMKSIYRLATEYQNICDCEQRVLFMYTNTKDAVKVYLSAYSREIVKKKKNDLDELLKNIERYSRDLTNRDIIEIVTDLQRQIKRGLDLLSSLIQFYETENAKFKQQTNQR